MKVKSNLLSAVLDVNTQVDLFGRMYQALSTNKPWNSHSERTLVSKQCRTGVESTIRIPASQTAKTRPTFSMVADVTPGRSLPSPSQTKLQLNHLHCRQHNPAPASLFIHPFSLQRTYPLPTFITPASSSPATKKATFAFFLLDFNDSCLVLQVLTTRHTSCTR